MPAMFAAISDWLLFAQESGADGDAGGGLLGLFGNGMFIPVAMIVLMFYVMLWMPERRKRAETEKMLGGLKKDDRVVTIGGVIGTVVTAQQGSDDVTLRIDENSNTRMRVLRSAIARVISRNDAKKSGDKPDAS